MVSAQALAERALKLGAHSVFIKDLRARFADEFILPAIFANIKNTPSVHISVSLSRPLITEELLLVAQEQNCRCIFHGGSPKSNDTIRFKLAMTALAPEMKMLTALTEAEIASYADRAAYAKKHSLPVETKMKLYEEDHNLWGRSVNAPSLEDLSKPPPEELFSITKAPDATPDEPKTLTIKFEAGKPTELDGSRLELVELIEELNRIGGEFGVGRTSGIQEKIVGFKTRMVSEAPAAEIIVSAHRALEHLVFHQELISLKESLEKEYANLIFTGFYFSRARHALEAFFAETQRPVTGTVTVRLFKGSCAVQTVESPFSLYQRELATLGEDDALKHAYAEGFAELSSLRQRIEARQYQRLIDETHY